MDLRNKTGHKAKLFHTIVAEDRLLASVVMRSVYRVEKNGLRHNPAHPWPVEADPYETPFGEFDGETPFVREGCDFFLLGNAYSSDPKGGATSNVEIRIGNRPFYAMRIFGDRTWTRQGKTLVPSAAAPFKKMPITWKHAFGGKCKVDTGELPYAANPDGRGYYWTDAEAEGKPLPNIELPDQTVRTWDQRPEPAGTGPYKKEWYARAMNGVDFDLKGPIPSVKQIKPSFNNNANPRLILPTAPRAGERIAASGVRPGGGTFEFEMPDAAFHVYVQLADRRYAFPAALEAIALLPEEESVMLGWRCCFRYKFSPLERRATILYSGRCPGEPPSSYTIHWPAYDQEAAAHG